MSLPIAPQLESWMSKDSPDSQRLRAFVEDALPRIAPYIVDASCGLELDVRLAARFPLITGGPPRCDNVRPVARGTAETR